MLTWVFLDATLGRRPSAMGACIGAVVGLVAITPAAGFVSPAVAIVIGVAAGAICYGAVLLKGKLGYDDALDAFGVHGVGGTLGALLTGVFATRAVIPGKVDPQGMLEGNAAQVGYQAIGVAAAGLLAIAGTLLLLRILDVAMGLRVTQTDELQGLDVSQHGEEGYIFL